MTYQKHKSDEPNNDHSHTNSTKLFFDNNKIFYKSLTDMTNNREAVHISQFWLPK